jgi:hypothetical protein
LSRLQALSIQIGKLHLETLPYSRSDLQQGTGLSFGKNTLKEHLLAGFNHQRKASRSKLLNDQDASRLSVMPASTTSILS